MVNSFVSKQDLDSEMTVVRNEFEMGENNPGSVLFQRMQQLAFPWHNYGNPIIGAALRHRAGADRQAAGLLPHLVPARQRGADRRRALRREHARLRLVAKHFGALPRPSRGAARLLHRRADAGRRAPRAPRARRRQPARRGAVPRARRQPSRLSRRSTCSPTCSARRRAAGCTAPSCRRGSPRPAWGAAREHARPGLPVLRRVARQGRQARRGARPAGRDRRGRGSRTRCAPRSSSARAPRSLNDFEKSAARHRRAWCARSPSTSRWATGGCSSSTATGCAR